VGLAAWLTMLALGALLAARRLAPD
jgi:hypothetical protein